MANNIRSGSQLVQALQNIACSDVPMGGIVKIVFAYGVNKTSYEEGNPFPSLTEFIRGEMYLLIGLGNGDLSQYFAGNFQAIDISINASSVPVVIPYSPITDIYYNPLRPNTDIEQLQGNLLLNIVDAYLKDGSFITLQRSSGGEMISSNMPIMGALPTAPNVWINLLYSLTEEGPTLTCKNPSAV